MASIGDLILSALNRKRRGDVPVSDAPQWIRDAVSAPDNGAGDGSEGNGDMPPMAPVRRQIPSANTAMAFPDNPNAQAMPDVAPPPAPGSATSSVGVSDLVERPRVADTELIGVNRNVEKYRNLLQELDNRDYSIGGKDRDKTKNWKDVLRGIGLGALQSIANAYQSGRSDTGAMLGAGLGGAIAGGVGSGIDRNFDNKMMDELRRNRLMPKYQRALQERNDLMTQRQKDVAIENIRADNAAKLQELADRRAYQQEQIRVRDESNAIRDRVARLNARGIKTQVDAKTGQVFQVMTDKATGKATWEPLMQNGKPVITTTEGMYRIANAAEQAKLNRASREKIASAAEAGKNQRTENTNTRLKDQYFQQRVDKARQFLTQLQAKTNNSGFGLSEAEKQRIEQARQSYIQALPQEIKDALGLK